MRLAGLVVRNEPDAREAQGDFPSSKIRLAEVEQEILLEKTKMGGTEKQSTGSDRAANEVLGQLIEVERKAQLLEGEVGSLKLQLNKVAKARKDATGLVAEKNRRATMLKARIGLFKDELEVFKRREWTGCGMEIGYWKVADAKSDTNSMADGLC